MEILPTSAPHNVTSTLETASDTSPLVPSHARLGDILRRPPGPDAASTVKLGQSRSAPGRKRCDVIICKTQICLHTTHYLPNLPRSNQPLDSEAVDIDCAKEICTRVMCKSERQ
jgi:hypothetical protein